MTPKEKELYDKVFKLEISTTEKIKLLKYSTGDSWERVLHNVLSYKKSIDKQ